ncbi:Tat pathway signal protein, partial [bacterium]|nr:Tat pathway signal protein [bacterium]
SLPALMEMSKRYGDDLFTKFGFLDSFNPTFIFDVKVQHGRVVKGKSWFDGDYIGIDQGVLFAMIENYRSGFIWKVMKKNPHIILGLQRAGFSGGWLEQIKN